MSEHDHQVSVDGRQLKLTRLDKVLYPQTSTTKAEVIDYLVKVSAQILPLLADRPVTRLRWPDGVAGNKFFEKNAPAHTPDWVRTVVIDSPGSTRGHDTVTYPIISDTAGLVWAGNLAALELHVPQWRVGPRGGVHNPDRLVIDLDPGAPAGLAECAEVAHLVAERLADDGLTTVPVTSGSKGMQLYAALDGHAAADRVSGYAKRLAESLAADRPDLVVAKMAKELRHGRILLDWSQNNPAKTTICPYSLRGRDQPWVAAPRSWDEIDGALGQLRYDEVLDRLDTVGDLAAPLLSGGASLP